MTGWDDAGNPTPKFSDYPPDFFDFIIIDECHRGGASDESTWRGILEYFNPAVQLGLTATPKRANNADTYAYFGEPVYKYALKDGINDGFLTPFKVRQIETNLDEYIYSTEDELIEGAVDQARIYTETDFNRIIEIEDRERYRVQLFMEEIDQNQKNLVFCANQDHALKGRDLTGENWLETLAIASTTAPQDESEAKSWQDKLLTESKLVPFPVAYETNEDLTWSKNKKGRLRVQFNGLSKQTFQIYCDQRQLKWFQRFYEDQEIKKASKNESLAVFLPCAQGRLLGNKAQIKMNLGIFITSSSTVP